MGSNDLAPHERENLGLVDEDQEDIGSLEDLDGDGVPDELEVGNLAELVAATSTEPDIDDFESEEEDDGEH